MSKSTISTFQLFEMFPTAESARLYLESRLWPDGAFCPECKSRERIGKQPNERRVRRGLTGSTSETILILRNNPSSKKRGA
jgi:hypothetical protein